MRRRALGVVEVVARSIAVAVEFGPAQIEVEPVGDAVAALAVEADRVGRRGNHIVADDDFAAASGRRVWPASAIERPNHFPPKLMASDKSASAAKA